MDDIFTASETTALTTSEPVTPDNITLPKLEEEIKYHLNQISQNIIEIGKRLIQAKSLVQHGQWTHWLQDNFKLSQNTAGRFMQCAERFGNSATSQNLNQSQMIALLSLPESDVENFIEQKSAAGTPVSDMSVKTLRKEIKQWKAENEEITPSNSTEDAEIETIDITHNAFPQKPNESVSPVSNEQATISPDNTESPEQSFHDSQQPYPETQSRVDETPRTPDEEEPTLLEPPTEIQGTYLIDRILSMCDSLIQRENRNEIFQSFATNNPERFNRAIQHLTSIISELKAIRKND